MKKREIAVFALVIIIFALGLSFDSVFLGNIPEMLVSKFEETQDLELVLYQVQATITTLGIALITILSGVSKDTVYGYSTARYILQIRPKFLKHRSIITALISLVAVNYVFLSFRMFNSLVSSLLITLVLILFMTYEIFTAFDARQALKNEIQKFIISKKNNIDIIDTVLSDTMISIDKGEVLTFKENMNLILILFSELSKSIDTNNILKEKWEKALAHLFSSTFKQSRGLHLKVSYSYFLEVYKVIAKQFAEPNSFVLWDNVSRELLDALKYYEIEDVSDLNVFTSLRWTVYECQYYEIVNDEPKRNNLYLDYLYNRIYYTILSNKSKTVNLEKATVDRKLKDYYSYISSDVNHHSKTNIHQVLLNEFRQYTKLLIDNGENEILNKTLAKSLSNNFRSELTDDEVTHYLTIIIYVFYLAEFEELIHEEQRAFVTRLLNDLHDGISNFLLLLSFRGPLTSSIIKTIRKNLDWWEYMPEDEVKTVQMDSAIDQFLIFNSIYADKNSETLSASIAAIIDNNPFSYVSGYTGDRKKLQNENYKIFVKAIYNDDIADHKISEDLSRLENILYGLFRIEKMENGKDKSLSSDQIIELESDIQRKITKKLQDNYQVFDEHLYLKEYSSSKNEVEIRTYSNFIESTINQIEDFVFSSFVTHTILLMKEKEAIDYSEVTYRDKNALNVLFELLNANNLDIDTLLGYRDWLFGFDKEEEFKKLEADSHIIKAERISDVITCVDSRKIGIKNFNVNVEIKDLDFEKLKKSLKYDENGRLLYNVTNDIFLPFEESELKIFISNTRKIIRITIVFDYCFSDEIVGVAVFFKSPK